MPWTVHIDGGARGNPGPAGAGVHVLNDQGQPVVSAGFFLGRKTNNEAEYAGLLIALDLLAIAGAESAQIYSDSELLVRQIKGQYKVRAPHLRPLFEQACTRMHEIGRVNFQHVRREQNREADALANKAMDAVADVIKLDAIGLVKELGRPDAAVPPAVAPNRARQQTAHAMSSPPSEHGVLVTVIKASKAGACPAGTKVGQTYLFTASTPAGLCVDGCSAIIDSVIALQSAEMAADEALGPLTITCGRSGCGAVFQLRPM